MTEINGVKVKNGTTEHEFATVLAYWCNKCPAFFKGVKLTVETELNHKEVI